MPLAGVRPDEYILAVLSPECPDVGIADFRDAGGLVDRRAGLMRAGIEAGVGDPLAHGHRGGENEEFGEELHGAVRGDAGHRDEEL